MIRAKPEGWFDVMRDYFTGLGYWLVVGLSLVYLPGLLVYLVLRAVIGDRFWMLAVVNNFVIYLFLPLLVIVPLAFFVVRIRWLSLLSLALLVAGVLWIAPYFIPRSTAAPAQQPTLTIATYNWWRDNPGTEPSLDWLRVLAGDVLLLQEVPLRVLDDLATLRDIYPYQYNEYPGVLPPYSRPNELGNVTLSAYPLGNFTALPITSGGRTDVSQQRMELEFNGNRIAIYNIHFALPFDLNAPPRLRLPLQLPVLDPVLRYNDALRDQQIWQFLGYVENETLPLIVTGNFNMGDQTQMYEQVSARLIDSFAAAGRGFGGSWPVGALPSFVPPPLRIDYIWHSGHFRTVSVWQGPDTLGSDHIPLVAELAYVGAS